MRHTYAGCPEKLAPPSCWGGPSHLPMLLHTALFSTLYFTLALQPPVDCQQLKDGISSIAFIFGLSSMAVNSFILILPLFYIQNGMYGNVRVELDG